MCAERGRGNGLRKHLEQRPGRLLMMHSTSPTMSASSMSWVTKTTARRLSAIRLPSISCISTRVWASSAPNGSSISNTCGVGGEGARNRHALLHAAGELLRVRSLEAVELHLRDPGAHDRVALRAVGYHDGASRTRCCGSRCATGTARIPGTPCRGPAPGSSTSRPSTSTWPESGRMNPGDRAQHGGLAAPGRAEKTYGLARRARRGSRRRRHAPWASSRIRDRKLADLELGGRR